MDRSEYIQNIKGKLDNWGKDLSVLQDDVDRSDEGIKEDYKVLMTDLMRNYEWIGSYLDELDLMTDESFNEEKVVLDERIGEFDVQLVEARKNIKDV